MSVQGELLNPSPSTDMEIVVGPALPRGVPRLKASVKPLLFATLRTSAPIRVSGMVFTLLMPLPYATCVQGAEYYDAHWTYDAFPRPYADGFTDDALWQSLGPHTPAIAALFEPAGNPYCSTPN